MAAGGNRVIPALLPLRGMGVRAVLAALPILIKKNMQEEIYKVYITDCLKVITKNTAIYGGKTMQKRYYDIVKQPEKQDNRTGEQIAADIINKVGIK